MSDRSVGLLDLAVMGLLTQRAQSGYDLLKVFSETAMGGFSSSPGAIYPALKRLEGAGSIKGEVENRDTLRPRRVYRLTPAGLTILKQQLQAPVTREDVVRRADGVLLRFAFAGEVLGADEATGILEEFAHEIRRYLPDLKGQLTALFKTESQYGWYALHHGIEMYEADARWAEKLARQLKRQAATRRTKR